MIHSATASDRLDTSVKASVISPVMPTIGADLPTEASAAVSGGDICQETNKRDGSSTHADLLRVVLLRVV